MTDTELPDFIEQDVLRDIENVEVPDEAILRCFVQSKKPYLSKSAVADMTNLSDEATRKRLNSLVDRGVLLSEKAGRQTQIYWINHPQSKWPVPNDLPRSDVENDRSITETMAKINRVTVLSLFYTFPLIVLYILDWLSNLPETDGIFNISLNVELTPVLALIYLSIVFYTSLQTSLHMENDDAGWPTIRRIYHQVMDWS